MLCICFLPVLSFSQDKQQLEKRRKWLINQIEQTNKLLKKSEQEEQDELANLQLLNTKTEHLQQLVTSIQREIGALSIKIQQNESLILENQSQLDQLRKNYSNNLVVAYKEKKTQNVWLLLLSSNSLNQAFRNLNYLRKWLSHTRSQADQIKEKLTTLRNTRTQLSKDKKEKDELLLSQKMQVHQINLNKSKIEESIHKLKDNQKTYETKLEQQKTESKQLESKIKEIIAKEMEAERQRRLEAERRRKLEAENQKKLATNKEPKTSEPSKPEAKPTNLKDAPISNALHQEFSKNKGKLPWPVSQGVIVSSLGQYGDKLLPGIKRERDGIDIRTNNNEAVNAIFEGQIMTVTAIPGFNKVVIIAHGSYFSVYGNLKKVYVHAGDRIVEGEQIGVVDSVDGTSQLHLQIWEGQKRLNPVDWIAKQ